MTISVFDLLMVGTLVPSPYGTAVLSELSDVRLYHRERAEQTVASRFACGGPAAD